VLSTDRFKFCEWRSSRLLQQGLEKGKGGKGYAKLQMGLS